MNLKAFQLVKCIPIGQKTFMYAIHAEQDDIQF